MGWHTLKYTKSGEKKSKEDKVNEKNVIKTVITEGENIETLLARALYDNLADAPDELSFRKGDIVTVIEQDVDGLIGWWLCLLHGKQGIAPGNRLKVIPAAELSGFGNDGNKSIHDVTFTTGSSDVHDPNSHYDYLPPPIKIGDNTPTTPLTIKEMFDIPYKKNVLIQEIYDVPRSENNLVQDEIYDVPRSDNKNNLTQDDLYDIPKTEFNNNTLIQCEDYDVPKGEKQEIYDIPKGYDTPRVNVKANQGISTYVAPVRSDIAAGLEGLEIYDTPVKRNDYSQEKLSNSGPKNDVNMNHIETPGMEIYDVPPSKNEMLVKTDLNDIYDIPNSNNSKNQLNFFGYDRPKNTDIIKDNVDFGVKPNTPEEEHKLDIDTLMGDILDSPFSEDPVISTIKRSPSSSKTTTPRNSMNVNPKEASHSRDPTTGQEIYDIPGIPRGLSEEIYDIPVKRVSKDIPIDTSNIQESLYNSQVSTQDIYDIPKPHEEHSNIVFQEIYDIPTSKFSRSNINDQPDTSNQEIPKFVCPQVNRTGRNNQLQDIYDTPKSILNSSAPIKTNNVDVSSLLIYDIPPARQGMHATSAGEEIYDVPPTARQGMHATSAGEEIYDVPPTTSIPMSIDDIYDVPISNAILADREEIYDVPTNNTMKKGKIKDLREAFNSIGEPHEDIYDVPANHSLKKVMSEAAYSKHRSKQGGTTLAVPEDDYVDYHDVWTNEPPQELFQEHNKSLSSPTHPGRPLSDEPKRSILDQINFDLVKELDITTTDALEQLRKLHLAVDTCVQTLLSFWSDNWLEIRILKQTIRSLRDFSGKLKTALRLLTEFGLSTLINCTKVPRGEALMDKLIIEVEPLLESYYKIKICLLHLDGNDWKVPDVRVSQNEKFFATLNAIMILSDRIPELCKAFNLGVQNKVHELFAPDPTETPKHLTPLMSFQPTPVPANVNEPPRAFESEIDSATLRRQTADRRQKARDSTIARPIPLIPPKPSLPNPEERRSLSGSMEPPESPRVYNRNRGFGNLERLVTDYEPIDNRQKKYASDPATPSCADKQKTMWGGSCPILMDRPSSVVSSPHAVESLSSSSSVSASIPEETIEIKQTNNNERISKNFPSDSNIGGPPLSPLLHTRSASLPWDDRLKNNITPDERVPKSPSLSPLDHRDIESLEFFCRQVESQVVLLRESMKNLTEAVENQEEPVVFVQYAKFISLTGHRVFHCGQDISERLINTDIKAKLKDDTAHLTVCIRGVVAATKTAALEYPNAGSMMEMISSVLALGDAVRIIYSVCRKALDS